MIDDIFLGIHKVEDKIKAKIIDFFKDVYPDFRASFKKHNVVHFKKDMESDHVCKVVFLGYLICYFFDYINRGKDTINVSEEMKILVSAFSYVAYNFAENFEGTIRDEFLTAVGHTFSEVGKSIASDVLGKQLGEVND